jgi:hypothetical protein
MSDSARDGTPFEREVYGRRPYTDEKAKRIANDVIEFLSALSNYDVDILLHGQYDSAARADRLGTEDRLRSVIQQVLES